MRDREAPYTQCSGRSTRSRRGRGSGALAALDDLDWLELLVAPPVTTHVLNSRGRCGAHDADTIERICHGRVRPAWIHLQGKVCLP